MRKLRYHEQKLLKKVDLYGWGSQDNARLSRILRRYHITDPADYAKYNRLVGAIRKLSAKLKLLKDDDLIRIKLTKELLLKLYNMGVINSIKSLEQCDKATASAFCRRRLPVVLCRLKMAERLTEAAGLIEQGHVRVGPNVVVDGAFLVPRSMEDFVAWAPGSKIRKHVLKFNGEFDDFDFDEL